MSVIIQGDQLREIALGRYLQGQTADITTNGAKTYTVFDVAGGEVLITAFWGKVTTALTVADGVNLQMNPTTGDTQVIVTSTDLGTTDTAVGSVIGMDHGTTAANKFLRGGQVMLNAVVSTGTVESVVTGTGPDGVVQWFCCWIPLTKGATLVASAVAPA